MEDIYRIVDVINDSREEFCQKENFPTANQLFVDFPTGLMKKTSFSSDDFVVTMSHQFHQDQIIPLDERLSVLRPKEHTKRLLKSEKVQDWMYSPIDMPLGAKGPVEVAVSVVAEMNEVWGKPVRERVEHL